MRWHRYQNADSMSRRTMLSGEGPASSPGPVRALRASVRCGDGRGEAVANAPQNGLGAAGDVDLAIERSDVGHAWLDTDATAAPAAPQRRSVKWR
jgi:hypothetical protein